MLRLVVLALLVPALLPAQAIKPDSVAGKAGDTLTFKVVTPVAGRYRLRLIDAKTGLVVAGAIAKWDSIIPRKPGTVANLRVVASTTTTITLRFTEVDNGLGLPADYEVRYATPTISWGSAAPVLQGTCARPLKGIAVGATRSCTVTGLLPLTTYQFQLVAFRGTLNVGAVFGPPSNIGIE